MAYEFKLEDPGEGIHEAEILEILVSEGDTVKEGDNVLVAETDKAAVEIPTPVSGTVKEIRVAKGDIAEVGDVLMVFEEEGAAREEAQEDGGGEEETDDEEREAEGTETEDEERDEAPADEEEAEPAEEEGAEGEAEPEDDSEGEDEESQEEKGGGRGKKDPEPGKSARKGARDDGDDGGGKKKGKKKAREPRSKDDEEAEAGGDEDGRKKDEQPRREKGAKDKHGKDKRAKETGGKKRNGGPVPASPAARRVARELGVALEDVEGSGEQGRVYEEDVRKAAEGAARKRGGKTALPDFERWGPTERVELRSIRRAIARRMAQSWSEVPHVTHQDEIDITELERLRRAHHDEIAKRGGALSLTPFFVKALVAALKQHPRFNSSLDPDADEIVLKHYYNIGVALDSERGLLVPVIKDADKKSIVELAIELTELAEEVRGGTASKERLRGGTFSLTNVGSLGGTQFSPLVNYPEAAIFGTARATLRPVAIGDLDDYRVEARLILPVCIAFDHRINDGADAARFMETVREVLSDPEEMVLMG